MNSILIVDDEKDNLDALRRLLRNQFDVTATQSPYEALRLIQTQTYSVILSDQRMPEMTGVELLEKAKNVAPLTTRILLTGYTDIESIIGAINRGQIYRYVAKPWDPEDLRMTLRQADEAFQLRSELQTKNVSLEQALKELKGLDRAKDSFVQLVSHELNTPLTVFQSYLSLLTEAKALFSEEHQKVIAALSGASLRFSEIVDEILSYVRMVSDSSIEKVPFSLIAETRKIWEQEPAVAKKQLVLHGLETSEVTVSLDGPKMAVGLRKLWQDLCQRAKEGSALRFYVKNAEGKTVYRAEWEGDVIPQDAFLPFTPQGEVMHHQRNLGLRLSLFRLAVEQNGGVLKSERPNVLEIVI